MGGPLVSDKLWLFSSYIPTIDTIHRTVNFTGGQSRIADPLPAPLCSTNMYNRVGLQRHQCVCACSPPGNYSYGRQTGQLVLPDSAVGQLNTQASTDPKYAPFGCRIRLPDLRVQFRRRLDSGRRKLVVSARYGYFFNNVETARRSRPGFATYTRRP